MATLIKLQEEYKRITGQDASDKLSKGQLQYALNIYHNKTRPKYKEPKVGEPKSKPIIYCMTQKPTKYKKSKPYKTNSKTRGEYQKYLASSHWRSFKKYFYKTQPKECCVCGDSFKLNLHHITYENLGKEKLEDVVCLCEFHHSIVHQRLNKDKDSNQIIKEMRNEKVIPKKSIIKIKKQYSECRLTPIELISLLYR